MSKWGCSEMRMRINEFPFKMPGMRKEGREQEMDGGVFLKGLTTQYKLKLIFCKHRNK